MKSNCVNYLSGCFLAGALTAVPAALGDTITNTANITNSVTWYSTNEYIMTGPVYVLSNAVLNIEAGTVVKGTPGQLGVTNSAATLFITRGGKLYANGTVDNPIIFTSVDDDVNDPTDLTIADKALWGGIVIFGNAILNTAVDNAGNAAPVKYDIYEGIPDTVINGQRVHRYGGTNDADNSGVLRYVSIRHGGYNITTDKEINGLSPCCVGSNTVIEYVEVIANADDGFEFFGGTVNAKYLVSAFNDDECFDIDQGYRGKGQFWFGIDQPKIQEYGCEWNGDPNSNIQSNTPLARFTIYNMTVIGSLGPGGTSNGTNINNRGIRVRDYAAPQLYNSIMTEFAGSGLRVEANTLVFLTNNTVNIKDNLWWDFKTNGVPTTAWENDSVKVNVFDPPAYNNSVTNPLLTSISRTNYPAFGLNPLLQAGSPGWVQTRTAPNDGFFVPVSFKGAFTNKNWAGDWTALSAYCVLSTINGGPNVFLPPASVMLVPPTLQAVLEAGNLEITLVSKVGQSYQLQSSTNVSAPVVWIDEGTPKIGTGGTLTFVAPATASGKFFQVQSQ